MSELPADKVYLGLAATDYDKGRAGNPVTDEDDKAIFKFLSEFSSSSVVGDAPCGTGRALEHAQKLGLKYRGADISPDMIRICQSKISANQDAELSIADARNLPWESSSCDALLSVKFLKWLPNDQVVQEVLHEYRRVCNGRAFLNVKLSDEVNPFTFSEVIDRVRKAIDRIKLGTSARYMTRAAFENMLKEAKWRIVRVEKNAASNNVVFNYIVE